MYCIFFFLHQKEIGPENFSRWELVPSTSASCHILNLKRKMCYFPHTSTITLSPRVLGCKELIKKPFKDHMRCTIWKKTNEFNLHVIDSSNFLNCRNNHVHFRSKNSQGEWNKIISKNNRKLCNKFAKFKKCFTWNIFYCRFSYTLPNSTF